MGKRRRKKTHEVDDEDERTAPKSFVLRKGHCSGPVKGLVRDTRSVMMPNTAAKLKERKHNTLKDYQNLTGPLGVSHLLIFTNSAQGNTYLRIVKAPQGPTLTFQVDRYALMRDMAQQQQRPHSPGMEYLHSPLVVMNNFSGKSSHMKLMSTTFQTLFPPINIQKIKLSACRRVLLLDYDKATDQVSFRHYYIQTVPRGVSRSIKRVVQRQKLPNLGDYDDISEYVKSKLPAGAESDVDDSDAEVEMETADTSRKGRGKATAGGVKQQCAVRMRELGPRMQLKLMKIQEGFCEGTIIYQHEDDKSSSGADGSMAKKKMMTKEQKQKLREAEMNRIEALAPMVPDKAMRELKGKRKAQFMKNKKGDTEDGDTEAADAPPRKMQKIAHGGAVVKATPRKKKPAGKKGGKPAGKGRGGPKGK